MLKIILCSLCIWTYAAVTAQPPVVVPKEIKESIPIGFLVMDCLEGDLNNDGLKDALLILKSSEEDSTAEETIRPLLLYVAGKDKLWKLAARNDSIIMCRHCGGVFGDPYEGMEIKNAGQFSLYFYGGSSDRWSVTYSFKYDLLRNNWNLESETSTNYSIHDPDKTMKTTTIHATELAGKNISNFSGNENHKEWMVVADKAFFYNEPSVGSKPKKAYVMKGDQLSSIKETINFIQVYFTNSNGTGTEGFILKKDVRQIGMK